MSAQRFERIVFEGFADTAHQIEIERDVVHGEQDDCGNFFCDEEVSDECAGEPAACHAFAIFVEWAQIIAVSGIANVEAFAVLYRYGAHASVACGHDAIEHIESCSDAFDEIPWRTDAHEVAREIFGHLVDEFLTHVVHFGRGFADGETADRQALEWHFDEGFEVTQAHVEFETALDDAEEPLMGGTFASRASFGPRDAAFDAGFDAVMCGREGDAIVEHHGDVAADSSLNFHAQFGRVEVAASVDMRLKMDAVGVEFSHF